MNNQLNKLAELFATDKEISLDEATKRITDAFYEVLPTPGGSAQTHEVLEYANNVFDDEVQRQKNKEEVSGYYMISGKSSFNDIKGTFYIHRHRDNLAPKEALAVLFENGEDIDLDSYAATILSDVFTLEEALKAIETFSPVTSLELIGISKGRFKKDHYASRLDTATDMRPKHGGSYAFFDRGYVIFFDFDDYFNSVVSFRDEKESFQSSNVPF